MRENDRPSVVENVATLNEKQTEARIPRAIRFSDSEWKRVKMAAAEHDIPAAGFVRNAALAVAKGKSGADSPTFTPAIVELIKQTHRSAYILSTLKRDEMLREGRRKEIDDVVHAAREVQATLLPSE